MILSPLQKIIHTRPSQITLVVVFLLTFGIWYRYSAIDYVAANYQSYLYAYTDTALSWGVIILFPILIASIVYKSLLFGQYGKKKKSGILGIVGGVLGVFITGASCCGITLISVLGLSSIIGFLEIFPYHGLEIKALGLIFLAYATYDSLVHLESCEVRR